MQDNQYPSCIVRTSPRASSIPIEVRFLTVTETENLLDTQEELISTPMKIIFESPVIPRNHSQRNHYFLSQSQDSNNELIILAIPYMIKRSSHRENVIKIRQANGIWISIETSEMNFDAYKVR